MKKIYSSVSIFILVLLHTSIQAQQSPVFTLISYNVLEGFERNTGKMETYVNWVRPFQPDMVALMELNAFTQGKLENMARQYNHPYAVLLKETGYAVGITSRFPIVNVQKVLDNMHHGYIYAVINGYHVFVTHLSPHRSAKRHEEIRNILAAAALIPRKEKIMIMGDLNSFSAKDSAVYNEPGKLERMLDLEKKTPHLANLHNGKFDYGVPKILEQAGYTDAFYLFHDHFDSSFPTKKYGLNYSFDGGYSRLDYVWLNTALKKKCLDARFIKDPVTDTLSDHYPLLVKLKE
jgi:exodeoxyribonuclease-3